MFAGGEITHHYLLRLKGMLVSQKMISSAEVREVTATAAVKGFTHARAQERERERLTD